MLTKRLIFEVTIYKQSLFAGCRSGYIAGNKFGGSMKNFTRTTLGLALTAVLMTGCQPKGSTETQKEVVHVTANDAMDSNALADAGEQLMSPYTFHLASKAFDMSLAKDPTNQKAMFYNTFLARLMVFKGILNRIRPLARKFGDIKKYEDNITKMPTSSLKQFLLDGPQDISDAQGVQNVLAQYRDAADAFRRYIKKNSDLNLVLNMNPYVFQDKINHDYAEGCQVNKNPQGGFSVDCPSTNLLEVRLNSADIVLMGQEAAGEVLYMIPYTTWNLNGMEPLVGNDSNGVAQTSQAFFTALKNSGTFGVLLSNQALHLIPELGADAGAAAKWALKNQNSLCQTGASSPQNRSGFLFKEGVCIVGEDKTNLNAELAVLDQALSGVFQANLTDSFGKSSNVNVSAIALFNNPASNLLDIGPKSYDACGEATSLKDRTLGGIFVDGNADLYILKQTPCGQAKSQGSK
jgi:hypothetical protein